MLTHFHPPCTLFNCKVNIAAWLDLIGVRNSIIGHKFECKASLEFLKRAFAAYHRVLGDVCNVTKSAAEKGAAVKGSAQLDRIKSAAVGSLNAVSFERIMDTVDSNTSWSDRVLGQLTRSQADTFGDLVSNMKDDIEYGQDIPVRWANR